MKKIVCAAALLLAAFLLLCSCDSGSGHPAATTSAQGGEKTVPAATTSAAGDPSVKDDSVWALRVNDVYITPNRPFANVIEHIGSYTDAAKSMGCMFTDEEWEYYYNHFLLTTYRDGGVDYVGCIQFTDDVITTSEGLRLGMTEAESIAICGPDFEDRTGTHIYTRGNTQLWVFVSGGIVTNISYMAVYD